MSGPRHTSISRDPGIAAEQNSENARDTLEALGQRLASYIVGPFEHTAAGDDEAKIPLGIPRQPKMVLCVRVQQKDTNSAKVATWPDLQFDWDGKTATAYVFEPTGLASGAKYLLTFLVCE